MDNDITQQPIWREMLSGNEYDALSPILGAELTRVKGLVQHYNSIDSTRQDLMDTAIKQIIGRHGENIKILQPFFCDYGRNIHVGENFFANFHFTVLDEGIVEIGDNAFIGPNVSIYTACHPLTPNERNTGREWSEGVTIGNNVWIGGSATIIPGVRIGNNVVIGAGSVVTKNVPDNEVWAGNPAKFIKKVQ